MRNHGIHVTDRPLAAPGLFSFRLKRPFAIVMIGATGVKDALAQANRSIPGALVEELEKWDGRGYRPVPIQE